MISGAARSMYPRLGILFLDILMPTFYLVVAGVNAHKFCAEGNLWELGLSIGLLALPGLLEVCYWLLEAVRLRAEGRLKGNALRLLGWTVFGVIFPIGSILW